MKILIPQNIFAGIFALSLPEEIRQNINVITSANIMTKYNESDCDIALVPSLDLLKNDHLFISGASAISFDENMANSYFYFSEEEQENFGELFLRGDISSNDLILPKILFKENFNQEIKLVVDTQELQFAQKNYLITGNENFTNEKLYNKGVSFTDIFTDSLNFPYVNFVFVSEYENTMKEFNKLCQGIDEKIKNNFRELLTKINLENYIQDFISENQDSIYFDFTENEELGLTEILRLPYYHGLFEEINELKIVK